MEKHYIVFFGAHSTGKTTIARKVSGELNQLKGGCFYLQQSGSRLLLSIEPNAKLNRGVNDLNQLRITFLNFSMLVASPQRFVVAERFVFDNLVYARLGKCDRATLQIHESLCEYLSSASFLSTCSFIPFYLPVEFPLEADGVRDEDILFQKQVDNNLRLVLAEYGIDPIELPGTVEDRFQGVVNELSSRAIFLDPAER